MDVAGVGVATAFLAGVVSFLSPCVLPLVPGYVSYVAGQSLDGLSRAASNRVRFETMMLSVCFIVGFSLIFIALGASATAIGQALLAYRYEFGFAAGIVVILFGLALLASYKVPFLNRDFRFHGRIPGGRPAGAVALGMAFAFGWTPCIGPVLGSILTVSMTQLSVGDGILLLAIYSLGLGLPFLIAAGFTGAFVGRLGALKRIGRPLHIAAGVVMVIMGILMITGDMSTIAIWLLNTFPVLAEIG